MKLLSTVLCVVASVIFYSSLTFAYLTDSAVGNTLTLSPLPTGNGNVAGTHKSSRFIR